MLLNEVPITGQLEGDVKRKEKNRGQRMVEESCEY